MDDDSDIDKDLDTSLLDPHHGLDSSTEEGENPDETLADSSEHKEDGARASSINPEHVSMLEEMVFEMKQGFQSALEELAKIQDKEEGGYSRKLQQQQQQQINDLTDTVHGIKEQITSLVKLVEQVQGENKKLKEDCHVLQSQVHRKGLGRPEEDMLVPVDASLEWTDECSHNPFGNEDVHNCPSELVDSEPHGGGKPEENDEVTAIACKSLSLTQALGEKYLEFNMSASSEDGEEPRQRRTSSITSKANALRDHSRRHSMPASTLLNTRNKQMARAAQRQAAVKELADSERDYCSQLWALLDTYLTPLQTTTFLTGEHLDLMFPPFLERLYMEHCMICSGLQDKLVHWSYMGSIANLLSRVTESHNADSLLSLYQDYCEFLPDAINCLREALAHSTDFRSFLKTIQQSSCQTDDLMTLIIAPVQHLPKYLLQLQQICKHTPSTHPDYLLLQTSLNRLRNFVEQVNEHVNSAMSAVSQESRTGSSNDSSQVLSARDSGVHSNEEEIPNPRNFFRSEQNLSPAEDWHEDMYYSSRNQLRPISSSFFQDQWHRGEEQRKLSPHFSALSQPDLTRFEMFGGLSHFNHNGSYNPIPRSQTGLPPPGANPPWANSRDGSGSRRKFKMRPRHGSPSAFQTSENQHGLSSPRSRPSSAIDFTNGHLHPFQSQHLHDLGAGQTRPRSAMAQLDPHHRPTIISRKHGRRMQPPLSSSGYWADNASSSQHKHVQSKMAVPPLDLLPSRPSPLPTHTSIEDDEEDDTRASDSHSFATSGSQRQSSSHCSRDDRELDLDLDLHQVLSESEQDNGRDLRTASEFSEEDVAASLAWKLCADANNEEEMSDSLHETHDMKSFSENHSQAAFCKSKDIRTLSYSKAKGDHDITHMAEERNGSGPNSNKHLMPSESSRCTPPQHSSKPIDGYKSSDNGDLSVLESSEEKVNFSDSSKAAVSSYDESAKEDDTSIATNTSNNDTLSYAAAMDSESSGTNGNILPESKSGMHSNEIESRNISKSSGSTGKGKTVIEHNRQFLLSLAQSPTRSQNSEPVGLKNKSVFSSTAQISLKNKNTPEESEKKIETTFSANSHSSDEIDSQQKSSSIRPSGSSRDTHSRRTAASVNSRLINGFHGLNGNTMIRTSSPNGHLEDVSKSDSDKTNDKGDNLLNSASEIMNKPRGGNTNNFLETLIDDSPSTVQDRGVDSDGHKTSLDSRMTRSLDMSELFITDDSKERRRDRKKIKESSGTYHPSDSLPKANDDPVGARKKMHLKSSIKNLFSKKRGRVIMADVEREVILEMASEALTTTKSSPLALANLSTPPFKTPPNSSTSNKLFKKNDEIKAVSRNCVSETQSVSENRKLMQVFEMRLKTDQGNSTDSPVKISQHKNLSALTNEKAERENIEDQNTCSQSRSWYDFLPFTQKKSPSQTSASDHIGKSKKSSPSSSQNKSNDGNLTTQEQKPVISKQEVDKCSSSSKLKSSGTNLLNNQVSTSKQVEKQKCMSDLSVDPLASFDIQQSHVRGKNYRRAEHSSAALEEFTQQQHKHFQEQMKKYAKLRHKGKHIDKSKTESQSQERAKEKEPKTRHHKHKDRTHAKKSSELHQCLNCQMKGKRLPSQDQTVVDQSAASHQTSSSKKNRNQQHSRRSNEISAHSNMPSFQRDETLILHNGNRPSTNEGMYVTFSHCNRLLEHPTTFETSGNTQALNAHQECSEKKDAKKAESMDTKSKTGKLRLTSKGNNLSQDLNMASGVSSSLLEKPSQNNIKYLSSGQSSLALPESKLTQNGDVLRSSSHLSKSSTNNLSYPLYSANGLNGLTFSRSPLCYNGVNIPFQNNGKTPYGSNVSNVQSANASTIVESVKRRNGGEYNNLSLDVHLNSLQADLVQKSYVKTVPWHGENISSKLSSLECSSDHSSHPLYDGTENQDIRKVRSPILNNASNTIETLRSKCKDPTLSSVATDNFLTHKAQQELSNVDVKSKPDKEDHSDVATKRLSPVEGEQNWQELLTTSHDYFNSKYRLCYDAEDQERNKSTPPRTLREATMQETNSNTPLSHVSGNNNNSAYVAFVSCPVISSSAQERSVDAIYTNVPSLTDHSQLPNGASGHPNVSTTAINPSSCAPSNPPDLPTSMTVNSTKTTNKFQVRKPDILIMSPVDTETDLPITSMFVKSTDPLHNATHSNTKPTTENSISETTAANHIISSISVSHGSKTLISPTTANLVYLPLSIANGNKASLSPLTCQVNAPLSVTDENKTSSVTKHMDYSKPMTNGFAVRSMPSSTTSVCKDLTATASSSLALSHCTNLEDNLSGKKDTPMRPTSLFVSHPRSSSSPPKSLQKVFPSTFCAPGAPPLHGQSKGRAGKCLSLNGAIGSEEEDAAQLVYETRREDTGKSYTGHSSIVSNHFTPLSNQSIFDSHFKHLNHSRQGIITSSPLHEKEKKSQPHMKPIQNHRIDDRVRCNGKNGHKLNSEPSHVFCVLPFGEYKVDNSAQCVPKLFSKDVSDVKENHQSWHNDNISFTRDHKAIQKRDTKNAVHTNESSRFSTCSSHSANEIQFLKSVDVKETLQQPNVKKSSSQFPANKEKNELERSDKSVNALQVRYTPKSGFHKKEKASTAAASVVTTSSKVSSAPSCIQSDGTSRPGVLTTTCQPNVMSNPHDSVHGEMASMSSGYANEPVQGRSSIASPDLLQVSVVVQPGSSRKPGTPPRQTPTRQTLPTQAPASSQPKKQSFLARLAHSPLSFLHRDSKNAAESK